MARKLIANDISPDIIAQSAGRPVEQVRSLVNWRHFFLRHKKEFPSVRKLRLQRILLFLTLLISLKHHRTTADTQSKVIVQPLFRANLAENQMTPQGTASSTSRVSFHPFVKMYTWRMNLINPMFAQVWEIMTAYLTALNFLNRDSVPAFSCLRASVQKWNVRTGST